MSSSLRHRFCTASSTNVLETSSQPSVATPRRQRYPTASMDMNRLASLSPSHGHDFQPKNKLIMVRKTEKRTFAEGKQGEEPTLRTVTMTTVQTFDGNNKVLRKVTKQKKDSDKECRTPGSVGTPASIGSCGTATPVTAGTTTPASLSNLNKRVNGTCSGSNGDVSTVATPKKELQQSPTTKIPQLVLKSRAVNGVGNGTVVTTDGTSTPNSVLSSRHLKERHQNQSAIANGQIKQDFAVECLEAHNEYRRLHGVPELKLDRKLSRYSQEWADHLAKVKTTAHRPNSDYGENIFFFWSSNPKERVHGRDPVDNWYKEIEKHQFGVEPKTLISGHMTQVLWKTSQRLGVGVARNSDGQTYVVCNYDPAGNYIGTYARNVPPIGGFEEEEEEDFVEQALRLHNEYRVKHTSPPLSVNTQLCAFAQDWADTLARTRTFQHRPSNPYGENIFAMRSSDVVTAADACTSWYSEEVKYHSYGQEPSRFDLNTGHFTQMVWKESQLLGIGRATTEDGQVIIVANYHPRGNVLSKFGENVLKPTQRPIRKIQTSTT